MRYTVSLEHGGWVVWDTINREMLTHPATSEEAQEACSRMNAEVVVARWIRRSRSTVAARPDAVGVGRRHLVGSGGRQERRQVDQGGGHEAG